MEFRKATTKDIDGVLALQDQNLIANLSGNDRKNGFVTTPFTGSQVQVLVNEGSLFVIGYQVKIIGYAFAGSWQYFEQWPIFPYMTSRFTLPQYRDWGITTKNSFQYGPICIDTGFRGQGLINQLFETLRLEMVKKYPLGGTFINNANERSLNAHTKKLGWTIVDNFEFNGNSYSTLLYNMNKKIFQQYP